MADPNHGNCDDNSRGKIGICVTMADDINRRTAEVLKATAASVRASKTSLQAANDVLKRTDEAIKQSVRILYDGRRT